MNKWKGGALPDAASVSETLPGGKVRNLTYPRKDLVILRRQGHTPTKISMSYIEVFKGLWRLWLEKRVCRYGDLASTAAEITVYTRIPAETVRSGLRSLVASGVVRRLDMYAGRTTRRYKYTPLPSGIELLAIADYLGDGTQIMVGRKVADWVRSDEPPNLFDFAKIVS